METNRPRNTFFEIFLLVLLFGTVELIGIIFYHIVENLNWIDAIYFTTATLTTLGYGDIVPQTDAGKLFTSVFAFLGIGIFFGMAGIIFHNTLSYSKQRVVIHREKRKAAAAKKRR